MICQGWQFPPTGSKQPCNVESENPLCWGCTKHLRELLLQLDELVDELQIQVTRQNRGVQNPGKTSDTPLEFNERASVVADELLRTVLGYVENPSGVAIQGTDSVTKSHALIGWMLDNVVLLSHRLDAGQMVAVLKKIHGTALGCIGRPVSRIFVGVCLCGRAVHAKPDQRAKMCACGVLFDVAAIRQRDQDAGRQKLVTPQQAAAMGEIYGVTVKVATIHQWKSRKKLVPDQATGLYRFGDIIDLARGAVPGADEKSA